MKTTKQNKVNTIPSGISSLTSASLGDAVFSFPPTHSHVSHISRRVRIPVVPMIPVPSDSFHQKTTNEEEK
jgi:hypothetical protein